MALIIVANKTARLITINHRKTSAQMATRLRLAPGQNMVDDSHWEAVKELPFTQTYLKEGFLQVESKAVEKSAKPATKPATKSVPTGDDQSNEG